ncbi:hypothetical protein Neosp_006675 [[Neocosmospora] mangrovei]
MTANLSVSDQIRQLNDARKLVLGDVKYYPSIVRGILPIIGPNAAIELRRWGAEFLAEAFATPALPNGEKETMQPYVLATLESMMENDREDPQVIRSVIQCAASIYPLALRWMPPVPRPPEFGGRSIRAPGPNAYSASREQVRVTVTQTPVSAADS